MFVVLPAQMSSAICQHFNRSPPPSLHHFHSFLPPSLSLYLSPVRNRSVLSGHNMHLCHSLSLICPQCQQRDARREERKRNVQMKEWRMRRDNVRTQKRTVSLIGKRYKEWVINNIHRSRLDVWFFLSLATGSSTYVCEMKWSTAVVAIFKYNLLTVQSNKSQSIWLTLVISPFLPSLFFYEDLNTMNSLINTIQLFIFDCSLGERLESFYVSQITLTHWLC